MGAEASWQESIARSTSSFEIDFVEYIDVVLPLLSCIHRLRTSVANYRYRLSICQRSKREIFGCSLSKYLLAMPSSRTMHNNNSNSSNNNNNDSSNQVGLKLMKCEESSLDVLKNIVSERASGIMTRSIFHASLSHNMLIEERNRRGVVQTTRAAAGAGGAATGDTRKDDLSAQHPPVTTEVEMNVDNSVFRVF